MKYSMFFILLFVIIGCSNDPSSKEFVNVIEVADETNEISLNADQIDPGEEQDEAVTEDITFEDFNILSGLKLQRELSHIDTNATYFLYEYELSDSILQADNWIRSESQRLGGKITERYSYDIESKSQLDLIMELPSKVGTRIISTYSQKYLDKQYLIIEETLLAESQKIDENYEDHALVIFIPQDNGTTKETFKGMYPHQHTDIFSYYFYTNAFFKELLETGNSKFEIPQYELSYLIGYFDKEGNEFDPYNITEENLKELTFGIQIIDDFLPKEKTERERLLFHWAKTLLLGDKAYSTVYNGTEQVVFLKNGDLFKAFSLQELAGESFVEK